MLSRIFYFVSALLILLGAFIFLTPSLLTPDLIYPARIDSTYLAFRATDLDGLRDELLLTPADLDLNYEDVHVKTPEGFRLDGWFVSAVDTPANTVLFIHDVNESRLLYIDHLKQFHDRGFNVAVFDLRAHGTSEGIEFSPGLPAVEDVKRMIDTVLERGGTRNIAVMGVGLGAGIALQTAVYDERIAGLVLQSPFSKYSAYLERYAFEKWGIMEKIWYPVFRRRSEKLLQYPLKELNLTRIAPYITIPTLFIIGSNDTRVYTSETLQVFDASASEKKELFLIRNAGHENIAKAGGEGYYNRIAAYLISNLPKKQKTTRFKKLALNDQ